ncbi:MAG: hypothetical protein OJI67_08640 [Prosthecobacter sp.]|nr:hypothetical protein [Prosthecobacter sp.]
MRLILSFLLIPLCNFAACLLALDFLDLHSLLALKKAFVFSLSLTCFELGVLAVAWFFWDGVIDGRIRANHNMVTERSQTQEAPPTSAPGDDR